MNDQLRIAKYQARTAMINTAKDVLFNPAVELLVGLAVINSMYEDGGRKTTMVTTLPNPINPLNIIKNIFGSGQEYKVEAYTNEATNTQEEWARQALLWVIIAQQLAPYAPGIISGVGSAVSGITGSVAGALTKGAVK